MRRRDRGKGWGGKYDEGINSRRNEYRMDEGDRDRDCRLFSVVWNFYPFRIAKYIKPHLKEIPYHLAEDILFIPRK